MDPRTVSKHLKASPGLRRYDDVRELIAHHLGFGTTETPALARGWRADLVGNLIDDLLEGKRSIRIQDPQSSHPLAFEPIDPS